MWVRGWFPDGAADARSTDRVRSHQRGYTLVNPDPAKGTVDIDFALHDGLATRWASEAEVGDTLEITVLGSSFALPDPEPAGYLIVGDTASLPAIDSLLEAVGDVPVQVFVEVAHDEDRSIPVGTPHVTWVDRKNDGQALDYGIPRRSTKAQAYWSA